MKRRVVDEDQARAEPYPYVYLDADESARELHHSERTYLETSFDAFDGARPAIKENYAHKNGWGEIRGFLKRSGLPSGMQVQPAPVEVPVYARVRIKGWLSKHSF
jgi:hypothetical protein